MKIQKAGHEFTIETVKTLRVERYAAAENHLRVVILVNDGKRTKPHLEKRSFVVVKEELRPMRQKMFNADDLKFLVENSEDIINLMEGRIKSEEVKLVGETGL